MSDNLIDQFDDIERRRQASARPAAAMSDPEAYAKAERWAPQLGLPVETVARNIGAVKPQVIEADAAEAASRAPALATWLGDLDNARVGIDQAQSLATMEGSVRDILRRPVVESLTRTPTPGARLSAPQGPKPTLSTIARGLGTSALTGFAQAGLGVKMAMGDALNTVAPSMSWTDIYGKVQTVDLGDSSGDQRQFSAEKNKAALARPDITGPGRYVYGGVESLLQTAPSIGASILLRNPAPALAMGGVQSGATQYGEVRTRGGTAGEAALAGGATGAVEVVTEKIPLGFIVDRFGKTEFKRFIGGMLAREIPSEQVATLAQDAIDTAIANPDATWQDYWAARPEAAAQTLASTVIQAGAIGAPALIMSSREGARAQRDLERAGNAPAVKARVDRLVEAVRASPMPERSPERFAALMNAISEDQEVRIPADRVREYLQSLEPDQQQAFLDATELGDQLDAAYGEASDIYMPAGEYLAKIGPTPAHDALSTYVGWGENMSEAEAKSYDETYSELAASQGEEMGDVLATATKEAAPGRAVFEDVQRQAREAGYTADAARQYASVWAARYEARAAASPDLYPDAMAAYQASRVQIRGAVPEGVSAAQRIGRLDVMIDSVRQGRKPAASRGPSLLDFISRNGGIVDQGGDLASLDAGSWHRGKPGRRKLLREAGDDAGINNEFAIERVVDRAIENGYLPEGSEPGDLMTAMADEMRGRPSFATPADQRSEDFKAASDQLEELMGRLGLNVDTASNEEIKAALEAYAADPGADGASYEQGGGVNPSPKTIVRMLEVSAQGSLRGLSDHAGNLYFWDANDAIHADKAKELGVPYSPDMRLDAHFDSNGDAVVGISPGVPESAFARYARDGGTVLFDRGDGPRSGAEIAAQSFNQSPTETDAFKAWFGDSKVVDESGKPLVVYHGTTADVADFAVPNDAGIRAYGNGIYFSASADRAAGYAGSRDGANVVPAYVSLKNPLILDNPDGDFPQNVLRRAGWREPIGIEDQNALTFDIRAAGYDGVIIRQPEGLEIVAFEATQIKSVFNSGRFDPADPRILNQAEISNTLVAVHNIKPEGLLNADKLGALPVPSLAIVKGENGFGSFGQITLVANPEMVDPKSNTAAKVFGADVYSPRYPRAEFKVAGNKIVSALFKRLKAGRDLVENRTFDTRDIEQDGIDAIRNAEFAKAQFLLDRGETPAVSIYENGGGVNRYATGKLLDDQIAPVRAEYDAWVDELTAGLIEGERIPNGYSYGGNRRYLPHDLDTVVKLLKKGLRDGEGFSYGVASIRSKVAPQFKTLKAIKDNADKIVSKADLDALKDEGDAELIALADRLKEKLKSPQRSGYLDTLSEQLKEVADTKRISSLDQYYDGLDDGDRRAVRDFLERLRTMPTEYFEAKVQRAVGINEFVGAIVPEGTSQAVLDVLAKNRVEIRTYAKGDEASRRDALMTFQEQVFFQRARGNITLSDAGAVIRLFQGRDLSTLLHEGAHLWLEELRADATAPGASEALKADWQAAKDYLKLDGSHDFGDIPVEAHETWARSVEAYFLEGKSPSLALRDVMARLKAWMLRIYRTIAQLNVPMDDSIRGVFDRLIATQEEIMAAQQGQALNRLFTDPKTAGMTAAEYDRYTRQDQQAQGAAHDRLLKRTMETIRRQRTAEWREEREGLREDVEAEIDAQADIAVLRIMAEGKMSFSRQALIDAYGSDAVLARLPRRVPPLYSDKGGLLPDVAAQGVGASSGEALVDALMNYEAQRQDLKAKGDKRSVRTFRVDEALDAEMISRHGDVLSDGSIEQEAFDALHERRRGALLAAEGAKLSELAKSETSPWSREAFEVFAREKIGAMRATKIRPAAFLRAERSAGIAAQRAWMTGDAKKALEAKFTQTVNFHLYRAALDAEAATNKAQALFERVMSGKDADVAKNRNLDMVQAARAILASYGYLDRRGSASAYIKALAEYDGATAATLQPYVDAAVIAAAEIGLRSNAAPPIDLATTDEFADLAAVIQQLWTMSRADKVVEIEGRKVRIDAISQELRDNLLTTHGIAPTTPGGGSAVTSQEKSKAEFQGLLASFKKVEEWAARQGPAFTRYVWRPIKDAADAYRADKNTYLSRLHDALKVIEPDFKKAAKIEAPELGYIFGGEKNAGLAELIGALRHIGNDSNKRKLLLGRGWGSENEGGSVDTSRWDAFLARMIAEGRLEKRHFDYLQAEWDLHEDIKPLAQKAHRAMYGRYFEEVTANAFVTPWGEYKGGYVAAKVDTAIDARAGQLDDADLLNGGRSGAFMFPGPANGFTKSRVEYNRPLDLNLRLVIRQMDDVLKFAHLGPAVRDVNRILTQKDFKAALDAYDPTAWGDMLLPWLERAVSQRLTTPSRGKAGRFLDRVSGFVSRNTGMTIMFGSLVNTAQQVTGLPVAALRTGKRNMGQALVDYLGNPAKMTEMVTASSRLMADRNRSQMVALTDAANDIVLNPNLYEKVVNWTARHAYFMQHAFQNVLDPIIWTAARNRAVELGEGNPEAYADAVVSSTQGSRNAEDVTRFATGPAWAAPFKMFSGYFLDQANMLTTEWIKAGSAGRKAEIYALGFLIPSLGAQIIADLLRGGWDDEEGDGYLDEFMHAAILSQIRYALAMIPIGGQAVNLAINRFDGKPYNDKLSLSPAASMVETIAAVPFDLWKIIEGEGNAGRTVKDVATATSLITGLPPIQRQAGYVADVASGKVEPTGPVDAARGFITGTASPASRE